MVIKYIGSKRTLVPLIRRVAAAAAGRARPATSSPARRGSARRSAALGLAVHSNDLATYSEALGHAYIVADGRVDRAAARRDAGRARGASRAEDGYFTEAFCRRARYFQPQNGAPDRRDPRRDRAATRCRRSSGASCSTSLLEAADRVDSTTGLQMAYLKSLGASLLQRRSSCACPTPSQGPAGQRVAARRQRARAAARRRSRLRRPAVQPALVLLQLPRLGDARPLGRARELRGREQARRLPRAAERLQLEARARRRRSPSCSAALRAPWLLVSVYDEGFHDAGDARRAARRASVTSGGSTSTAKRYVGAQIGIYNPSGEKVGTVSRLRNREISPVARRRRDRVVVEESPAGGRRSARRRPRAAATRPRQAAVTQRAGGERQERRRGRAERRRGEQRGAGARRGPGPAAAQVGQRHGGRGEHAGLGEHHRVCADRSGARAPSDGARAVAAG